ncbi:hypothetical protein [Salinibacter grassmerensis]|uniref:hypothetical protein n=1 Tax=Salinibacter grassmerensis TaxID=3040353 RepID=UPI0021E8C6C9|nr:hypothetical protein [Salinibacter grassmerensis]
MDSKRGIQVGLKHLAIIEGHPELSLPARKYVIYNIDGESGRVVQDAHHLPVRVDDHHPGPDRR